MGALYTLATLVAGGLMLYGFAHVNVNVGSLILATELIFAMLLGYAVYGEVPSGWELIGAVLIASAAIAATERRSTATEFTPVAPGT